MRHIRNLIRRLLYWWSGHLKVRIINRRGDEPYLERYSLFKTRWLTAYLHRFVQPDEDEGVHDHPWKLAVSVVLAGSYDEDRLEHLGAVYGAEAEGAATLRRRTVRWLNVLRGASFHRIVDARPDTWTLFIHTPSHKQWGFLEAGAGGAVYGPFDSSQYRGWEGKALRGKDSNRFPLQIECGALRE